MRSYKDFPRDIKRHIIGIYPKLGYVCVNGGSYYWLKDLKNIELNTRLSFPHKLFVAINKAKNK